MSFRFHVKCNTAHTYCAGITRKRKANKNKAIILGFGDTVQQNENGVRGYSGGFLQTLSHSTLQCANIRHSPRPAKAPYSVSCSGIPFPTGHFNFRKLSTHQEMLIFL